MTNLKLLGIALIQYAQEYDETYPPMQNLEVFRKAILPYVKDDKLFSQPKNQKPYLINPELSGKSFIKIKNPTTFVALYEAEVGSDGKRGVAFADGHVKRVRPIEWTKIKKDSRIK